MINYPAWKNGEFCQMKDLTISVLDLGFIHCDATYDVISVQGGVIQNLNRHIKRFIDSAHGWRIPLLYTEHDIKNTIETLVNNSPTDNLLVWIGLTRGIPNSGNPRDLLNCRPNIFIYTKPYYGFNSTNSATICLANTVYRTPNYSINQLHKNFAWNDLTKAQWEAIDRGYDSAILATYDGIITEGVGFNVAIITGEKIIAPKSNRLEGTVMNLVKDLCETNNRIFEFVDLFKGDMLHADAMFLTSTAGNVIPVTKFENKIFNSEKNETLAWLMKNI